MTRQTDRRKALELLRARRFGEALALLDEIVARPGDADDLELWVAIAQAARALGHHDRVVVAADRILAREPRHLFALIAKGDALFELGDRRAAGPFFLAALNLGSSLQGRNPAVESELARIRKRYDSCMREYEDYLRAALEDRGFTLSDEHASWSHAIDILFGKRRIYHQEPHRFYFPYLPQRQFYDPREFPWTEPFESGWRDVLGELEELLARAGYDAAFAPYLEATAREPQIVDVPLRGSRRWGACYLWRDGGLVHDVARNCPRTVRLLEGAPMPHIPGKAPSVLFSALQPHTHIPPHHGLVNTRLICHLPLIVPEGCWLRVGNEKRFWRPGRLLIFDDSIEHEAMNPTDELRVVLLFEIWRPELSEADRAFVTALFEAIETYGNQGS